jgi:hypothetical protein
MYKNSRCRIIHGFNWKTTILLKVLESNYHRQGRTVAQVSCFTLQVILTLSQRNPFQTRKIWAKEPIPRALNYLSMTWTHPTLKHGRPFIPLLPHSLNSLHVEPSDFSVHHSTNTYWVLESVPGVWRNEEQNTMAPSHLVLRYQWAGQRIVSHIILWVPKPVLSG